MEGGTEVTSSKKRPHYVRFASPLLSSFVESPLPIIALHLSTSTWARFANFNSSFLGTLDAIEAGDLAHDHGDFGKLGEGMRERHAEGYLWEAARNRNTPEDI